MDPEAPAVLSLGSNRIQVQTCSIGESLSRNVPFANLTKRQICGSFSFLSYFLSPFKHWTIGMLSRRKTSVGFERVSNEFQRFPKSFGEFQRVPRKDLRVWKNFQRVGNASKDLQRVTFCYFSVCPTQVGGTTQASRPQLLLPMLHQRKSLDNGNAKAAGGDEEDNLNFSGPPWQQLSWRHLNCIKTGSQIAPGWREKWWGRRINSAGGGGVKTGTLCIISEWTNNLWHSCQRTDMPEIGWMKLRFMPSLLFLFNKELIIDLTCYW